MAAKKTTKKRGPAPKTLKIEGGFEAAVDRIMKVAKTKPKKKRPTLAQSGR